MKQSRYIYLTLLFILLLTACGNEPTPPPTEVYIPPTPTPIVHTMTPGQPVYLLAQLITDCTVGNGVTVGDPIILSSGCDRWDYNKIERPFEDTFTNYAPQSDISRAQVGYDDTWFFAQGLCIHCDKSLPYP